MPLKIGDIVARYRIDGVLGSGGMGQVYLARDTALQRTVAIKLNDPRRQRPHELVREARLAASLDHPSICTIHGVDYLGEEPFLVMEHVKGMPLSKVIRGRRPLSAASALDFARHQMRNHLAVGFAEESPPVGDQLIAQRLEILDNAIVHQRHRPGDMRMGIAERRRPVRRPARVRDPHLAIQRCRGQFPRQIVELALGPPPVEIAVPDGDDPGRIIPAIFQPPKPVEQPLRNRLTPANSNNSTHYA